MPQIKNKECNTMKKEIAFEPQFARVAEVIEKPSKAKKVFEVGFRWFKLFIECIIAMGVLMILCAICEM